MPPSIRRAPNPMKTKFFFFGCWNLDNCAALDFRHEVITSIRSHPFDFGIIAGDNIYPRKSQDKKPYYQSTLQTFHKLPKIPIYVTIGNHDVKKESILRKQLITVEESNATSDTRLIMTSNVMNEKRGQIRILCIDTNLLGGSIPAIYSIPDIPFLICKNGEDVVKWLSTQLSIFHVGWTIIVGHEPLVTVRPDKERISQLSYADELIELIAAHKRCVYMCADTHNFQAWNITCGSNTFPMIVSGTGGAKPDPQIALDSTYASLARTGRNQYSIAGPNGPHHIKLDLVASRPAYGYCDILCSSTHLYLVYISLSGCIAKNKEPLHIECGINGKLRPLAEPAESAESAEACTPPPYTNCDFTQDVELTGGSNFTDSLKKALLSTRKPVGLMKLLDRGASVAEIKEFLNTKPKYIQAVSRKLTHPHLIARIAKMFALT